MSICECVKQDPWGNCCRLAVAEKSIILMREKLVEISTRTLNSQSTTWRALHNLAEAGLSIDKSFKSP